MGMERAGVADGVHSLRGVCGVAGYRLAGAGHEWGSRGGGRRMGGSVCRVGARSPCACLEEQFDLADTIQHPDIASACPAGVTLALVEDVGVKMMMLGLAGSAG